MSKTLAEIAQQLKNANKKAQLIYAFNGSVKFLLDHLRDNYGYWSKKEEANG